MNMIIFVSHGWLGVGDSGDWKVLCLVRHQLESRESEGGDRLIDRNYKQALIDLNHVAVCFLLF